MEYLGHYDREKGNKQLLKEHLENVASLAGSFANVFGESDLAEIIGKYHDIGKYSKKFQEYILSGENKHVDHSTAGAQLMAKYRNIQALVAALCIAGHHGGIPNLGGKLDGTEEKTLYERVKRKLPNYEAYKTELRLPEFDIISNVLKNSNALDGMDTSFYIRMLYSCLVDADFLDTEKFMSEGNIAREKINTVTKLCDEITTYITKKLSNPTNELNIKRCQILQQCIKCGKGNERGLFTLSVPTGGGKTISSLAFALNHAVKNNLDRIIYVIPYTSIIEQNAKVFADILGEENILEHHMNIEYDDEKEDNINYKKKLATENWDASIIVTTNVQFFESLFGNKPSKCRKLHNIANSVIIFDEVQMLPLEYLKACVEGIKKLVQIFNCTAVLCSATQPALNEFLTEKDSNFDVKEIVENSKDYYEIFKRNKICRVKNKICKNDLVEKLSNYDQVLCIVNKKITAQNLITSLKSLTKHDGIYHLSTNMYPVHRRKILSEIRTRLKSNLKCIVVSTSLVEAGVDIDFPVVYRELTGLDSIIQSAGRCNREGKKNVEESKVYVFELNDGGKVKDTDGQRAVCTLDVMQSYNDLSSEEAIKYYFSDLYKLNSENLDKHEIIKKSNGLSFKDIADKFKLIKENTKQILIPDCSESEALADQLSKGECNKKLLKLSAMYSVNVYDNVYNNLSECGKLELTASGIAILNDISCYDKQMGIISNCESGNAIFF